MTSCCVFTGGRGPVGSSYGASGGFAGGLFAIFVPSANGAIGPNGEAPSQNVSSGARLPPTVELMPAQRAVFAMVSLLLRIERESQGRVRLCRNVDDIQQGIEDGVLAPVLHIEGAEAIDPNFELLDVLYAAGLRSLGPVWSRSNAFGHGVPFLCPSSPDTGPGLTDLGKELIGACNRLRILIDLSHLNERGFWDVAAISKAPLVATHSNAHALSPHSRNLTDKQLTAIGEFRSGVRPLAEAIEFTTADVERSPKPVETFRIQNRTNRPQSTASEKRGQERAEWRADHGLRSPQPRANKPTAIGDPRPMGCPREYFDRRVVAEGVGFEPTIRLQVCTLFQWLVRSERLQRRPAGVALERGCDVFDDLFLRHFSER